MLWHTFRRKATVHPAHSATVLAAKWMRFSSLGSVQLQNTPDTSFLGHGAKVVVASF